MKEKIDSERSQEMQKKLMKIRKSKTMRKRKQQIDISMDKSTGHVEAYLKPEDGSKALKLESG